MFLLVPLALEATEGHFVAYLKLQKLMCNFWNSGAHSGVLETYCSALLSHSRAIDAHPGVAGNLPGVGEDFVGTYRR